MKAALHPLQGLLLNFICINFNICISLIIPEKGAMAARVQQVSSIMDTLE
jgi:hypothetical protein